MYEVLQFRPTLYVLVALGFTGFTLATVSPLMWLASIGLLGLNAWLVRTNRFRPIPRWLANGLTLVIAIYTGFTIYNDPRPIFPIGDFLVMLQIIKAFEQRANRDYAQLLVLSLLLMVAAAISTAGLWFGIVFIIYLFISPFACLLFHLKVEADHAKRSIGLDERQPDPMTLRQDQRFLSRSMTRVTFVVGCLSATMAILVFVFFPRTPGMNLLAFQFRPGTATTGMSEEMSMRSVTSVQQNTADIAALRVTHNDQPVSSGELYLRGMVYDIYDGNAASATAWSWSRSADRQRPLLPMRTPDVDEALDRERGDVPMDDKWVQDFTPLKPTGVRFLLALPGATRITVDRPTRVGYTPSDGLIRMDNPLNRQMTYRVTSTNVQLEDRRWQSPFDLFARAPDTSSAPPAPTPPDDTPDDGSLPDNTTPGTDSPPPDTSSQRSSRPSRSIIAPEIATYARRPDVSGVDATGRPLIDSLRAGNSSNPPPITEVIAHNIEQHLQTHFSYSLDPGDGNRSRSDDGDQVDPVVRFLYDTKKGWCEHYAYAMTLMCQSLGMQARLVSGYKCDEYNSVGGYFIVRQSNAHAWVEVLVRDGAHNVWRTFDPTGSRDSATAGRAASVWTQIGHVFDYLEHVWANSVVAYDAGTQSSLFERAETKMVDVSNGGIAALQSTIDWCRNWWTSNARYAISVSIIMLMMTVMSLLALGLIVWYVTQRLRLKRRARRIGLDTLAGSEARRLARQLGFYDDLVRVLERRDIVRAPHLTPLEFGHSLSFLPRDAYDTILRLTRIFYRIRFGDAELTASRRRALGRVVDRLRDVLNPKPSSKPNPQN